MNIKKELNFAIKQLNKGRPYVLLLPPEQGEPLYLSTLQTGLDFLHNIYPDAKILYTSKYITQLQQQL